jgi:hypothetical protein
MDIEIFLRFVSGHYSIGNRAHSIKNRIIGFQNDQPVFLNPDRLYRIDEVSGMVAKVTPIGPTNEKSEMKFISRLHTQHTVSMFKMAWAILLELKKQPRCHLGKTQQHEPFHVDISKAHKSQRHKSDDIVYIGAVYSGDAVVLKTTSNKFTMLKYILDAVIHYMLMEGGPSYVPPIKFVKLTPDNKLVICSEQLKIPSVATWMRTLRTKHSHQNLNRLVFHMLRGTCLSIRRLQKDMKFTHRDAHTGNVYYDESTRQIQFIDFDFSAIVPFSRQERRWIKMSVPCYLYDTSRRAYATNKSVDLCIFLRHLGKCLKNVPKFKTFIYDPIMREYEDSSKAILMTLFARGEKPALRLYKMNTSDNTTKGEFSHRFGIQKAAIEFEYLMGYYEWPCMTPNNIIAFMESNEYKLYG